MKMKTTDVIWNAKQLELSNWKLYLKLEISQSVLFGFQYQVVSFKNVIFSYTSPPAVL